MSYTYNHPRPMVTVDIAVLRQGPHGPEILLIQRKHEPFQGAWALPGGFVNEQEDLEDAARRELEEETGLTGLPLSQLYTVGTPGRDPRGHTISIVYVAACPGNAEVTAGDDAAAARWFGVDRLPEMAFDHADILEHVNIRTEEDAFDESE